MHHANSFIIRLRQRLRPFLSRPLVSFLFARVIAIGLIITNLLSRARKANQTPYVCSFPRFDVGQSLQYLNDVFDDYFAKSGFLKSELADKRVLEVGPGENLGVALRFLASGAAEVVSVDRFRSLRPVSDQVKLYRSLIHTLPPPACSR